MSIDFPSYHYLAAAAKFIESSAVKILLEAELKPSYITPEEDVYWRLVSNEWLFRSYTASQVIFNFPASNASILKPVLDKPDRSFHLIMTRYYAYLVCYEGLMFEGCLAMQRKAQWMVTTSDGLVLTE